MALPVLVQGALIRAERQVTVVCRSTPNPLPRKPHQTRQFAGKPCLFNVPGQTTNLGVRGSNPFGRAST